MYLKKEKQQKDMNHINIDNPKCVICKNIINTELEKWVLLQDFNGKNLNGNVTYHLDCWQTRFQLDNSERKKQMVSGILEKLGVIKNEVII